MLPALALCALSVQAFNVAAEQAQKLPVYSDWTRAQLSMLLEGFDWERRETDRRYRVKVGPPVLGFGLIDALSNKHSESLPRIET
jgi:hypothetical protein